jgi:quinolinate synthetase complex, A subunit
MDVENRDASRQPVKGTELKKEIELLKKEKDAVVLAHYYTRGEIQDVADFIGDSLALAQIARKLTNKVIVLCGVHFMGETAKILCPDKKVLVPDLEAGCSLADSCQADAFADFIKQHPGHTVVSYVNTSAAVKALTDVVVTSSNARKIVEQLPEDEKIIFGPDRNLGSYISAVTGREMVIWDGACHVHEQFSLPALVALKKQYPDAKVLAHPECRKPLIMMADVVGSTAALLKYAQENEATQFIVATESGILHEMRKNCPDKEFIPVPPESKEDGTPACGCNDCAYMKLNTLEKLYNALNNEQPEIIVDEEIARKAVKPIERMLAMS